MRLNYLYKLNSLFSINGLHLTSLNSHIKMNRTEYEFWNIILIKIDVYRNRIINIWTTKRSVAIADLLFKSLSLEIRNLFFSFSTSPPPPPNLSDLDLAPSGDVSDESSIFENVKWFYKKERNWNMEYHMINILSPGI